MKPCASYLTLAGCLLGAWTASGQAAVPDHTDWALLGNGSDMQYHSELKQINRDNVAKLGLVWSADIPTPAGLVGNPLIKDGSVFQGGPRGFVVANDVRTGKVLWTYQPQLDLAPMSLVGKWGAVFNRGVALADGKVIIAVACKLVALDQKTGRKMWEAHSCDSNQAYTISAAPRVGGGLVFTGNSCVDSGLTRGYVDAFDSKTGKHAWRFYTVPDDPSKPQPKFYADAAKTWGEDWYSKTRGCGSVWEAIVYDEKLDQVYLGSDVAAPIAPTQRGKNAGDELYAGAVIALDAKIGAYKWHWTVDPRNGFNFTPVGLMIGELPRDGKIERSVIVVPKNGFIYTLDAVTGKFRTGKDYLPQNWAKGLDGEGHPIVRDEVKYWEGHDAVVLPSGLGGHSWEPMAFDPGNNTVFIPSKVAPQRKSVEMTVAGDINYITNDYFYGKSYGDLVAWDVVNQRPRWRVKNKFSVDGGALHTDGGLVFQGTGDGMLNIYDADSGKRLWSRNVGGVARAGASTVMVDGQQYVIVPAGNASASAATLYQTTPTPHAGTRLLAFAVGGRERLPAPAAPLVIPKPTQKRFDKQLAMKGSRIFIDSECNECHGWGGRSVGGYVPNLAMTQPDAQRLKMIAQGGALEMNGMPKFDQLSDDDIQAINAYLTNDAWDAYEKQQHGK